MKYKFEQFKSEIVDPIVIIDYENILINNVLKLVRSVDVVLETPNGSKFGVELKDISIGQNTWDDCDLELLVLNELQKFKVEE